MSHHDHPATANWDLHDRLFGSRKTVKEESPLKKALQEYCSATNLTEKHLCWELNVSAALEYLSPEQQTLSWNSFFEERVGKDLQEKAQVTIPHDHYLITRTKFNSEFGVVERTSIFNLQTSQVLLSSWGFGVDIPPAIYQNKENQNCLILVPFPHQIQHINLDTKKTTLQNLRGAFTSDGVKITSVGVDEQIAVIRGVEHCCETLMIWDCETQENLHTSQFDSSEEVKRWDRVGEKLRLSVRVPLLVHDCKRHISESHLERYGTTTVESTQVISDEAYHHLLGMGVKRFSHTIGLTFSL